VPTEGQHCKIFVIFIGQNKDFVITTPRGRGSQIKRTELCSSKISKQKPLRGTKILLSV